MNAKGATRVWHMISGDLWAGAESQTFALLQELHHRAEFEVGALVLNQGTLAERLTQAGVRVHVLDETRHHVLAIRQRANRLLVEAGADILHCHRYKENVIGGTVASAAKGFRRVKTIHGLPEPHGFTKSLKLRFYQWLDDIATRRRFHAVVCVSQDIERQMKARFPGQRVCCIHNGIAVDACRAGKSSSDIKRQLGVPDQTMMVGTASRLVAGKGLAYLLEAGKRLMQRNERVRIVIVGDGPERPRLEAHARSLGIAEFVLFTGHVDNACDYIAAMDLFVLPSLGEGIPMVILEAMTLGTPIVATRVGGLPELIFHGQTGLLVEPADAGSLFEACQRLISDQDLARTYARQAQENALKNWSVRKTADAVTDLYRTLLP